MFDDGTEMTFFDWSIVENEPSNIKGEFYLYIHDQFQYKWHDVGKSYRPFICEIQL